MKKWLILLVAFGLLVFYVSSHFVVAQPDDNSGGDEDDSDSNDDSDDENEIEIKAEVEEGETKIKIKVGKNEQEVVIKGELTVDEVVAKVTELTDLSEETIRANLKFEIEDSDSDDDGVDDDTENEIAEFNHNFGAEMRFLQLEYSIKRRILWMNAVIERLNNSSNLSVLEGIVSEMEFLVDETENANFALSKEELSQLFIDIKTDARGLVGDFRASARGMLSEDDKNALRLRFEQIDRDNLKEIREKIRERRREYNGAKVEELLQDLGESDAELIRKVKAGELRAEEVRAELKSKIENKAKEIKEEMRVKIREEADRRRQEVRQRVESYTDNIKTRTEARIRDRLEAIGERDSKIETRVREEIRNRL